MTDGHHEPIITPGSQIGQFIVEESLGIGNFASVWKCRHVLSNQVVAVKVIQKASILTAQARTRLNREISLLKRLNHPFIAQFFEQFDDANAWYLVMEFVEHGNLLNFINENGALSEDHARRYFLQLISVLEYLHGTEHVMHRDIKAENILLDRFNNIRVIDFGLANVFAEKHPKLRTACGSPAYVAPALIHNESYTTATDIWSAGVLLYGMVVGRLPFEDDNVQVLLRKIVWSEPTYPPFMSPALVDLVRKMLVKTDADRITLEGIQNHPWFSLNEYRALLQQSNYSELKYADVEEQGLDEGIVRRMTELGVDCKELHRSLLNREFNDGTTMYSIFIREKMTERMRDLQHNVVILSQQMAKPLPPPIVNPRGPKDVIVIGAGGANPRILAPGSPSPAARRRSRPMLIRRPVDVITRVKLAEAQV